MSVTIVEAAPRATVTPGPRVRSILALTRVEGRRLITHPAILVGPGLVLLVGARSPSAFQFLFLSGIGYFAIGLATFIAANLCATRSRRDKTNELYASLPLRVTDRTVAQLLSVAFPLAAAMLIAGGLAMATRPWAGASVRLDIEPRTVMHGLPDFAQAPLVVAFLGVAGVTLGRWFIAQVAVPILFAVIISINSLAGLSHGALHWLNPVSSYSTTSVEPASTMPWHLMYLVGVILLIGLVALARRSRTPGLGAYGALAVALTGVGGVMQVLAASP